MIPDRFRIPALAALVAIAVAIPTSLRALEEPCPKERFAEERLELKVVSLTVDGVEESLPPPPEDGFVLLYEANHQLYGRLYDPEAGARDRLLERSR